MPRTNCGFVDQPGTTGLELLVNYGPTLLIDVGFDPGFNPTIGGIPIPSQRGILALVDTGATESCIDSARAATLGLPVFDRRPIAGTVGAHEVNMHLAQIHVPALNFTIYGAFAAVNLAAGGQQHRALIGRTFLQNFTMIYNGRTGAVEIYS